MSWPSHAEPDRPARLQKVLAAAGVGSRRTCERLVAEGRVAVNGATVDRQGVRVDPRADVVTVDGRPVHINPDLVYLALNKPAGVLCAMSDARGRRTVADYLGDRPPGLFHVGRLDADTEGLLLFTNDGPLAHRLAHPSYGVAKTYLAEVTGPLRRDVGRRLRAGVVVDGRPVEVTAFRVVERAGRRVLVELTLHEGRKHIVRRLLAEVGHPVARLVRTAFGPVRLGTLPTGRVRALAGPEIAELHRAVGHNGLDPTTTTTTTTRRWSPMAPKSTRTSRLPAREGAGVVVAIDGPGGAGKSTVSRRLAERLGLRYLDTGAMYRALTWAVLRAGIDPADGPAVTALARTVSIDVGTDPGAPTVRVDGRPVDDEIRTAAVTAAVSAVAAHPAVRGLLVARQREIIGSGGIVVEGRDIGTVVAADAALKVFLTASAQQRARRRAADNAGGRSVQATESDLHRRDRFDSSRLADPLRPAADARLLDTTDLDVETVVGTLADLLAEVSGARTIR